MNKQEIRRSGILIMTAVDAEREAVLRGLNGAKQFDVVLAGVGPASAAAKTAFALAKHRYDLVISAGIGGGFVGRAGIGSTVIGTESIAADLGAETAEGFLNVTELGFGTVKYDCEPSLVTTFKKALQTTELDVQTGSILTISTVTGTKESADILATRHPNATAEAMEGFGVAVAAKQLNIPFIEIRTISNAVGPRNRDEWRIGDALASLENTFATLLEVL